MMAFISSARLISALLSPFAEVPVDPVARTAFPQLLIEFGEGSTTYGYPDNEGNITIGRGNMLQTYAAFAALDWQGATANQIQTAWTVLQTAAAKVKRDGPDRWPGGGHYEGLTTIRATQASIDALIDSRLNEIDAVARTEWPGWDDVPRNAQEALARLMWACGPELAPRWPKLHAAWVAKRWDICAQECRIPSLDQTETGDPKHGIPSANDLEAGIFESCVPPTSSA